MPIWNAIGRDRKDMWDCFEDWRDLLRDLKLSTVINMRSEDLMPETIYRAMPDYLTKDLDDTVGSIAGKHFPIRDPSFQAFAF